MKRLNKLVLATGLVLACEAGVAQTDDTERARFSEPLSAQSALDAFTQAAELGEIAETELQKRYLENQDQSEPLKRTDPILYAASWPHDACNSIETLIPPPLEGWGLRALNNLGEIPINDLNADIAFYA